MVPTWWQLYSQEEDIEYYTTNSNHLCRVTIATYVGQSCPLMASITGRFFGKKEQVLDKYGANLVAATLPGGGHRVL